MYIIFNNITWFIVILIIMPLLVVYLKKKNIFCTF